MTPNPPPDQRSKQVGVVALDGFSLMSYACAVEPFRAANLMSGKTLYSLRNFAVRQVGISSQGMRPSHVSSLEERSVLDFIFVIAGGDPFAHIDAGLHSWLRKQAVWGATLCGVSGGPVVLAQAGLMAGYRMTVHWDHAAKLQTLFPDLMLGRSIYVMDRRRLTSAGGVAAFDMALALIAKFNSPELAEDVSNWFLHTAFRQSHADQITGRGLNPAARHNAVVRGLRYIQNHLGEGIKEEQIADHCRLSTRQLSRLFKSDLGKTPTEVLRAQRFDLARRLLQQTSTRISEIALSSGFQSFSHFSSAYKDFYGISPSQERKTSSAVP